MDGRVRAMVLGNFQCRAVILIAGQAGLLCLQLVRLGFLRHFLSSIISRFFLHLDIDCLNQSKTGLCLSVYVIDI